MRKIKRLFFKAWRLFSCSCDTENTALVTTKAPSGGRRLCVYQASLSTMRLRRRNDDRTWHRLVRLWYGTAWHGTSRGVLRSGTGDNGRIAFAVMVMMVMMAADGGESQGSNDQQGEEFTHGHVSFFVMWGTITDGFAFDFFRCLYSLI